MAIGEDSWWKRYRNAKRFTAEEEFYLKLLQNPVWPFENFGNGLYYLKLSNSRIYSGIAIIIAACIAIAYFYWVAGVFTFPTTVFVIFLVMGVLCILGRMTSQELIIGRGTGYILRLQATKKVIVEQDIYNIYIRLQRKSDSVQTQHFYLIIGGYLLDDIRISRMTHKEGVIRQLGKYLAHNMSINYFDYYDETIKHQVYHFHGGIQQVDVNKTGTEIDVIFEGKPSFTLTSETQMRPRGVRFAEEIPSLQETAQPGRKRTDGFTTTASSFEMKRNNRRTRNRQRRIFGLGGPSYVRSKHATLVDGIARGITKSRMQMARSRHKKKD